MDVTAITTRPWEPLLDDYAAACKQHGASGRDFRLLGDKAYSHPRTRTELRSRRIKHTIPQRSDQIARRKAKGSTGGRPPAFDAALYGLRNTVERGFNRLKQWRGVATRYALTYLGGVLLACAVIHARVGPPNWETRPSPGGGAPRPCPPPRLLTAARHDGGAPIICVIAARIVWRASGSVIRRRDSSVR